jgi:hypothetical protein
MVVLLQWDSFSCISFMCKIIISFKTVLLYGIGIGIPLIMCKITIPFPHIDMDENVTTFLYICNLLNLYGFSFCIFDLYFLLVCLVTDNVIFKLVWRRFF